MKNKNLIIVGALAILLIIFVVTVFAFRGSGEESTSETTEMSTVAVVTTTEEATSDVDDSTETVTVEETTTSEESNDDGYTSDVDPEQGDINPNNSTEPQDSNNNGKYEEYSFRNKKRLEEHYEKHGKDMGFKDAEEYEEAASKVVNNPNALHKIEKEDGDDVYYVESTNEFVVVSTDGYIRTYFNPNDGINYYKRQ